jgi:hypothetical protein
LPAQIEIAGGQVKSLTITGNSGEQAVLDLLNAEKSFVIEIADNEKQNHFSRIEIININSLILQILLVQQRASS